MCFIDIYIQFFFYVHGLFYFRRNIVVGKYKKTLLHRFSYYNIYKWWERHEFKFVRICPENIQTLIINKMIPAVNWVNWFSRAVIPIEARIWLFFIYLFCFEWKKYVLIFVEWLRFFKYFIIFIIFNPIFIEASDRKTLDRRNVDVKDLSKMSLSL